MRVFVVAGEPSGDALGQAVMAGLRQRRPDVAFDGVGGPLMAAEGLVSRFPMGELSLMGLVEIVPKYFPLKRRIRETAAAAAGADILLTIDSPDFCLRVARMARAMNPMLRTVHYVAPSVWAWRPKRAVRMAPYIDHVLALLDFEPPLMQAAGMACDFVGHPVAAEPQASAAEAKAFRAVHDLAGPVLLVLPGSRGGEVARLGATFGAAIARFVAAHPGTRVVVPLAGAVAGTVRAIAASWPGSPVFVPPAVDAASHAVKHAAFRAADLALAASGTVSLELAAAGTPMVIAYDMAPLSRLILSRMLLTDTVTLVNLVSRTRAVPEFIGRACEPVSIAGALARVWAAPEAQNAAMAETMVRLGRGGPPPGLRAADAILARLDRRAPPGQNSFKEF